jgi:hypothetical protein
MPEFKVFYSWQSDLPNATNRGFIGDALAKACKHVENDPDVDEAPRLDQDTQGLPGAPSIPQAIMEKIDECQAFVADVSLCYRAHDGTMAPNPNVIYELGYAVARLGWDRIILLVNAAYGPVEGLPFDLEKRRAIPYTAKEGEENRSEEKKRLVGRLAAGIELIAKRQPIVPKRTPADTAIEAIEGQVPARKARIRDFWQWVMSELHRLEPDLKSKEPQGEGLTANAESLMESIAASGLVSRGWSQVCEAIAYTDDAESAEAIARGFISLLEEYDHKPGFSGTFNDTWFDFWRFVGHELMTVWVACLLREERWALLDQFLGRTYFWEQHRARTNQGVVSFDEFSVFVILLGEEGKKGRRLSLHADILSERYSPSGIGSVLTFQEFIDADLFLFLAGEFRLEPGWGGWLQWRPWSVLYMKHQPRFLVEATTRKFAAGFKQALGETDSEKVRSLMKERLPMLSELWRGGFWHSPVPAELIDSFDTKKLELNK